MMQSTLYGLTDEERIIAKYRLDYFHRRGTKNFEYWLEHFKEVEEHNKRLEVENGR